MSLIGLAAGVIGAAICVAIVVFARDDTSGIEPAAVRDARLAGPLPLAPEREDLTDPGLALATEVRALMTGPWLAPLNPELAYVYANMPKVITNGIYRPRHAADPGDDTQEFSAIVATTWSHADIEALENWCSHCEGGHHIECPGCACPCGLVHESGAQIIPVGHGHELNGPGRDVKGAPR